MSQMSESGKYPADKSPQLSSDLGPLSATIKTKENEPLTPIDAENNNVDRCWTIRDKEGCVDDCGKIFIASIVFS